MQLKVEDSLAIYQKVLIFGQNCWIYLKYIRSSVFEPQCFIGVLLCVLLDLLVKPVFTVTSVLCFTCMSKHVCQSVKSFNILQAARFKIKECGVILYEFQLLWAEHWIELHCDNQFSDYASV